MARIQDYYQNRRDLGPSSMVAYLDAWLDERAGMNKSLMASGGKQADPSRLAEQEARIRQALADLLKAKVSGSVEEMKAADDLAEQALKSYADVLVGNVQAGAKVAESKIKARTDISDMDVRHRQVIAKSLTPNNPDTYKVMASAYKEAMAEGGGNSDHVAAALIRTVNDVSSAYEQGDPSKRDAVAAMALEQAKAAGNNVVVARLEKAFFDGDAAADYFDKKYPGFTPEEQAAVWRDVRKLGAGASPEMVVALYEKLTSQGKGGGGTKKGTSYSDIVPDLDDKIKSLQDAADDLAKARHAAMTSPRRFPRPNYMIANPNTFTDPAQVRELRMWGVLDPTYVEEAVTARQREGTWGGAVRSMAERGGASQSIEKVAPLLLTEEPGEVAQTAAEGAWLATLEQVSVGKPIQGAGGYTYTLNADGSITSQSPEKNKAPVTLRAGSKFHTKIVEELFPEPVLPDAVAAIYAPSVAKARAGHWSEAAAAARNVSKDDVRAAYAQALVDVAGGRPVFSGVPKENQMEALVSSVGEGGGKWGEHLRSLLSLPMPNRFAKSRVMGAVESLGKALHKAPEIEQDLAARAADEREFGVPELLAGRELNEGAFERGVEASEAAMREIEDFAKGREVTELQRQIGIVDQWMASPSATKASPKELEGAAAHRADLDARLTRARVTAGPKARADVDALVKKGRGGVPGDYGEGVRQTLREATPPRELQPVEYFAGPTDESWLVLPQSTPDAVEARVADEGASGDLSPEQRGIALLRDRLKREAARYEDADLDALLNGGT